MLHQRLDLGILTTLCIILDIFKLCDNLSKAEDNIDLVFIQLAGIFSPERPSWIPQDTLQLSTRGVNALNLNLKLPQIPKFFQDLTGIGRKFRRKMSVPVWNIYETLQYIYKTYDIVEDEMSLVPVDEISGPLSEPSASLGLSSDIAKSGDSIPGSISNTIRDTNSIIQGGSLLGEVPNSNLLDKISSEEKEECNELKSDAVEASCSQYTNIPSQEVNEVPGPLENVQMQRFSPTEKRDENEIESGLEHYPEGEMDSAQVPVIATSDLAFLSEGGSDAAAIVPHCDFHTNLHKTEGHGHDDIPVSERITPLDVQNSIVAASEST